MSTYIIIIVVLIWFGISVFASDWQAYLYLKRRTFTLTRINLKNRIVESSYLNMVICTLDFVLLLGRPRLASARLARNQNINRNPRNSLPFRKNIGAGIAVSSHVAHAMPELSWCVLFFLYILVWGPSATGGADDPAAPIFQLANDRGDRRRALVSPYPMYSTRHFLSQFVQSTTYYGRAYINRFL